MNYPLGIKNNNTKHISYGNRGMVLEEEINCSNKYYLVNNIAVIHKKPTAVTIKKVDYKSRFDCVIKEAYFKTPSTTDYNGIYKGKYIDFEAKETKKDYFPLANIHKHQIKHLKDIYLQGGIGFIIVMFSNSNELYLLEIKHILSFIDNNKRKSIPKDYFFKYGYRLKEGYNPRIDYLTIVDKIMEE